MKTIIFAATIALLTSTGAFAGKTSGCNPAIQNWVNGSKTTCVFDSAHDHVTVTAATEDTSTPSDENLNDQIK
jgi:hypothetical protein